MKILKSLLSIIACFPISAFAADLIEATVGASFTPKETRYEWQIRNSGWTDATNLDISFDGPIKRHLSQALEERVSKVVQADQPQESARHAIFRVEILNASRDKLKNATWTSDGALSVNLQTQLVVELEKRELWRKDVSKDQSFPLPPFSNGDAIKADTKSALEKLIAEEVVLLVKEFFSQPQLVAKIEDAGGDPVDDASMAGLQPLFSTSRVTEAEGIIRKKPSARAGTVRKLGMGSIVQIIGKLPTGWLQVAKEGEAIGWIHESSVTAMSVQQQPAVAAVAAPQPARPAQAQAPVAPAPAAAAEAFPTRPVAVSFKPARLNPDDVAVIIGNANYKATAKDIPDVVPAYADAEGMRRYAVQALGVKEENVIFIKDAKLADMIATFGNDMNPKGKLWNWVKPGRSQVFVYFSGHGAPSSDGQGTFLVPVDAQASLIDLSGYPLRTLYGNLAKLPAKSVTVVLEACFSGASQTGTVIRNASPVFQKAVDAIIPPNLTVMAAGSSTQIASWEQDKSHGLFTKHYLLGMAGAADKKPYGNGDGKVTPEELESYLKETLSYLAQRYYGREQVAQFSVGKGQ